MTTVCGCTVPVEDVFKAIETLLTPVTSDRSKPAADKTSINGVLQMNLDRLHSHLNTHENVSSQLKDALLALEDHFLHADISITTEWNYVKTLLQLLYVLVVLLKKRDNDDTLQGSSRAGADSLKDLNPKPKRPQDAPPLSNTALSVTQVNLVKNALQFVARLGICPNLMPGVGIPLQHRSKLPSTFVFNDTSIMDSLDEEPSSRRQKLCFSLAVLTLLLDVKDLGSLLLTLHLNDILAGLLQLVHAYPPSEKDAVKPAGKSLEKGGAVNTPTAEGRVDSETDSTCTAVNSSSDEIALPVHVNHLRNSLTKVLSATNSDLLIRELMVLQAGIPQKVQAARKDASSKSVQPAVHPPPPWLRKACSQLLQRVISGPKGIIHLYTAMAVGVEPTSPAHWKCCEAVAKVISRCPVPASQSYRYVEGVSEQLFEILELSKRPDTVHMLRLVGSVVNEMAAARKQLFHQLFVAKLMQHLTACLEGGVSFQEGHVVVEEEALSRCLENLHKVCVLGQQPQAGVLSVLQPVVLVLWVLFGLTHDSVYNIRQYVRELLTSYLRYLGGRQAAVCIKHLAISRSMSEEENKVTYQEIAVKFESGGKGGLKAVQATSENTTSLGEQESVNAAIALLGELEADGVAGELLVLLLKELTGMISSECEPSDIVLPVRLERSEVREQKAKDLKRKVTLLHLLASICETFGSECLADARQILQFVKVSLERGVAICKNTDEEEMAVFETETMSMAMGLLTTVLAGAIQMDEDHKAMMHEMLPLLAVIGEGHPDEFIREMASDIRITIATQGAVWSTLNEKSSGCKKQSPSEEKTKDMKTSSHKPPATKPLIEVLSDSPTTKTEQTLSENLSQSTSLPASERQDASPIPPQPFSSAQPEIKQEIKDRTTSIPQTAVPTSEAPSAEKGFIRKESDASDSSPLRTVFEQLCDPLIPVRGHALMALAKLVQESDPETLSRKDTVQKIFQENMHHGDSYLYLAAINGMSALADRFPESVVPALAEEFAGVSKQSSATGREGRGQVSPEHRLKLGEALMKATRNLGTMIPHYRDVLLAAVMSGARDKDPTVRASSVSNLAELCQLLHFAISPVLQEVLACCSGLLTKEETMVRRAAALTLAKILEGLEKDAFVVLESNLRDLYRLLKKLHEQDADDAVRLHANMALVQLDSVAREFLFPRQSLQKKIQVLPDAETFR